MQAAAAALRQRLRFRALFPLRRPPQVRHCPQSLRRFQRQQNATGNQH